MRTFGIKALQTNPSLLTKAFESGEYSLITKHGSPIGVAVGFDTLLIDEGLKHFLALKAFSNGDMSLGELAACFGQTRAEVIKTLGRLHIPIADYRIEEELDAIATLAL
jgi:hypothetical protein